MMIFANLMRLILLDNVLLVRTRHSSDANALSAATPQSSDMRDGCAPRNFKATVRGISMTRSHLSHALESRRDAST